jgi:hypothetical protein
MKKLLTLLSMAIILSSCSGSKNLAGTSAGDIPKWYENMPEEEGLLFSASTATSRDMQLAMDKAMTAARGDLARAAETRIESIQEDFSEEVGANVVSTFLTSFTTATRVVTDKTLNNSNVTERQISKEGGVWRAYVLMSYSTEEADKAFMDEVAKEEELYTRFRKSEAFKRLDQEVQKNNQE